MRKVGLIVEINLRFNFIFHGRSLSLKICGDGGEISHRSYCTHQSILRFKFLRCSVNGIQHCIGY